MPAVDLSPSATNDRPWPLPERRWAMSMRWATLAFLHWPVPAAALRPLVPAALDIDTFEGEAWLGIVPFRMEDTRLRGLPLLPGTHTFGEVNLRTYVVHRDATGTERAGVWFFSLDAASFLGVRAARLGFGLPYFDAEVSVERSRSLTKRSPAKETLAKGHGVPDSRPDAAVPDVTHPDISVPEVVRYFSRRTHRGEPHAAFRATVRPMGTRVSAPPGSLTRWFTERYALFAERRGTLVTGDIHHAPWPLCPAEARIETNTLASAFGLALPDTTPLVHYADGVDVVAWPPYPIA